MKEELVKELINKQLAYVNKTINDVINVPEWYNKYEMTEEQYEEWKTFCIDKIKKSKKYTKTYVQNAFSWFNLMYGLKVKQNGKI
jgi:hypothetical protein